MLRVSVLVVVLLVLQARPASATPGVLALFSDERAMPAVIEIETAIRAALGLPEANVEYSGEFLDATRFEIADADAMWVDFLRRKYAGHDIRALVAISPQALEFLIRHQASLFPGVPVFAVAIAADRVPAAALPGNMVLLPFTYDVAATVELARRLQPGAVEIVVPLGTSSVDHKYEELVQQQVPSGPGALPVRYLRGLTFEEMVREVGRLSDRSIGLAIPIWRDGGGRDRIPLETATQIVTASGAPFYSPFSTAMGIGVVGGRMSTYRHMGEWAGQSAKRILSGETLAAIPMPASAPSSIVVDWRALQRWGLDEARLDPGTEVRFKAPTIWQQYRGLIVTVTALVLLLAASLVALLVQRRRRDVAEAEVYVVRNELTHLTRVSIIGELSASLAHELNQPLTAILSNAQAAERMLKSPTPDLDMIRDILTDITNDDRRAGEVIRRLRALLKKGEPKFQRVHGAEIVDSVLRLARHDLIARQVTVTTSLEATLPSLNGDLVQLQQVLLNLVINAADAVKALPRDERRISISTARGEGATVKLTVSDRGHGIAAEDVARVFQPFFTTKAEGLGIGLAISRTIVEAHGGRLWASNNPDRGASLHLELPAA